MAPAYEAPASWVSSHGGEPAGGLWQVYFSDPASEPDPATWRTEIVQPNPPV
jgi:effector-binding domain-containing protein